MLQGQLCTVLLQYIPPARAETCGYIQSYLRMDISIHSTREGGDSNNTQQLLSFLIKFQQTGHTTPPPNPGKHA